MSQKIMVSCLYAVNADTEVELPEGKTPGDIKEMFVKWNILCVEWHNGEVWRATLTEDTSEIESKNPLELRVYPMNEDGTCDYDETILEEF